MNRLNRKVEYALMALQVLSENGAEKRTSVNEICSSTGAPFDATSRVMQQMVQAGILKSEHGSKGGYQIIRSLDEVNLNDVIEATLGPIEIVRCISDESDCELTQSCKVKRPIQFLNLKMRQFYRDLTVAEILLLKNNARGESAWDAPVTPQI